MGFDNCPAPSGAATSTSHRRYGNEDKPVPSFRPACGIPRRRPRLASFSDEHLDLLEQQVVVEDGVAVFTGLVENTHSSRSITLVSVYVVLKDAEGLIIDIVQGFPDDSLTDIAPGEQRPYAVETSYEESDFDTYTLRVEGILSPISPHLKDSLVTGEVVVLKESLTFTTGPRELVIILRRDLQRHHARHNIH